MLFLKKNRNIWQYLFIKTTEKAQFKFFGLCRSIVKMDVIVKME